MAYNEESPLVSVMMPVYNGINTLPLAVNSLLSQTHANWFCIIVNDGSTDGTKEYLDNLTDPRFKIIHFEVNKGRPYARQAALEAAKGEYLAYLDADDFYHPEKIQKQLDVFIKNPQISLVSCGMGSFNDGFQLERIRCNYTTKPVKYKMGQNYKPARAAAMVRLPDAKFIKYNLNLKYAQDTDYFVRYMDDKFYINIEDVLYFYSEFNSVTKSKILKTYYYVLRNNVLTFKSSPAKSAKEFTINSLKFVYTAVLSPFVSKDYFLKKRGAYPDKAELQKFNDALKRINRND
ncbi:glycosyltransferase family 2 protein [Flavobacterium sp. MK4S-17]|jgi:glycosyltransferase involved in cell wall biosynthesis|uniref:glycosyltransferase family 2 protein n=1 Tax=Flavobacterium sp. MK4S-17 TaxID=2543737 RepID=UPI0013583542|nr:glycosyltransferase family 2 protein [Flavobacterium sp. MK4S-17]